MIPHKSRLFRAILDLSFQLRVNGKKLPSVNIASVIKAPQKAMAQLGFVLKRIIFQMGKEYDLNKPFMYSKVDIKDGFWRLMVSADNAWHFCYVLPPVLGKAELDDIEIVVPNALQMGWCESPPLFCTATETARDVIEKLTNAPTLPQHPLESYLIPETPVAKHDPISTHHTTLEVYVDDFISMTNDIAQDNLAHLSRAMLHGAHSVFPPPAITNHPGGDPVSLEKLKQEEGRWEFEKEILGWIFNGKSFTIQLPTKKIEKIQALIKETTRKKIVTLNDFHKITGILVHASVGIPNGAGLLSALYKALQTPADFVTISMQLHNPSKIGNSSSSSFKAGQHQFWS